MFNGLCNNYSLTAIVEANDGKKQMGISEKNSLRPLEEWQEIIFCMVGS